MLPWLPRRASRLCWPQTATPDSSWPRWTRCGSAPTSVTWGWMWAAGSLGSTGWCSPPAARISLLCSPGGCGRPIKRRCRSSEWRLKSLRFCWSSYTQVCMDPDIPTITCNQICMMCTFLCKWMCAPCLTRSDQCDSGERPGADGGSRHAAAERGGVYLWRVPQGPHGSDQLCGHLSVPWADCLHGYARVHRELHSCPLSGGRKQSEALYVIWYLSCSVFTCNV